MVYWEVSVIVLWVVVLLLLFYLIALTRQIGVLHLRIQPVGARTTTAGLDVGEYAPMQVLTSTKNTPVYIGNATDRDTILLFLSTSCPACQTMAEALSRFVAETYEQIVLVFGAIDPVEVEAFLHKHRIRGRPVVISPSVVTAFRVSGVPYGFAIDRDGKIRGKGIVNTAEHIESLVNTIRYSTATMEEVALVPLPDVRTSDEHARVLERG